MESEIPAVPVIGITGNMGAGKSLFSEAFVDEGAIVIDADRIGHEILLTDKKIQKKVMALLGEEILTESREMNRIEIARRIFPDPDMFHKYNAIVQPKLVEKIQEKIQSVREEALFPIIAVDAAVIYETGSEGLFDTVIVVVADEEERLRRMTQSRRFSPSDVRARMAVQIPQKEKIERADMVIWNNGSIEELQQKAKEAFHALVQHAA